MVWWREVYYEVHQCLGRNDINSTAIRHGYLPDLIEFSHNILEIRANRWYHEGIDTTGADTYLLSKQLQIALQWNGLLRDIAVLEVVSRVNSDVNGGLSLDLAENLAKQARDTLKALHGDVSAIKLISVKLAAITDRNKNSMANNFSLPDSMGKAVSLSEYRGKIVLLHYWGTWCGPCLQTLPATEELEQRHKSDSDLVCINVAVEQSGFNHWKNFLSFHHSSGIELYADADIVRDRSRPCGFQWVQWFPTYILIDRQGRLISCDAHAPDKQLEADILKAESEN